jgi:hypothetical protein
MIVITCSTSQGYDSEKENIGRKKTKEKDNTSMGSYNNRKAKKMMMNNLNET